MFHIFSITWHFHFWMDKDGKYINRCTVGCTVMDCIRCCYGMSGMCLFDAIICSNINIFSGLFAWPLVIMANSVAVITFIISFCLRFCGADLSCADYWCCCRFDSQDEEEERESSNRVVPRHKNYDWACGVWIINLLKEVKLFAHIWPSFENIRYHR